MVVGFGGRSGVHPPKPRVCCIVVCFFLAIVDVLAVGAVDGGRELHQVHATIQSVWADICVGVVLVWCWCVESTTVVLDRPNGGMGRDSTSSSPFMLTFVVSELPRNRCVHFSGRAVVIDRRRFAPSVPRVATPSWGPRPRSRSRRSR